MILGAGMGADKAVRISGGTRIVIWDVIGAPRSLHFVDSAARHI